MSAILFVTLLAAAPERAPQPPDRPSCAHVGGSLTYLATDPPVARQGATIRVRPTYRDGPDGEKDVPERCLKRWKVEGAGIRFDRKARSVTIDRDAAPGSVPMLAVRIGGNTIRTGFRIVGADEQVLTGRWQPSSQVNCGRPELGEIVFGDNGRYSFTFRQQMIETMTSGSGQYRWDSATGKLELGSGEGAAFTVRHSGTARLSGGTLITEGIDLGYDRPPPYPGEPAPPPCRMTF